MRFSPHTSRPGPAALTSVVFGPLPSLADRVVLVQHILRSKRTCLAMLSVRQDRYRYWIRRGITGSGLEAPEDAADNRVTIGLG
jgi:hypothetical protein